MDNSTSALQHLNSSMSELGTVFRKSAEKCAFLESALGSHKQLFFELNSKVSRRDATIRQLKIDSSKSNKTIDSLTSEKIDLYMSLKQLDFDYQVRGKEIEEMLLILKSSKEDAYALCEEKNALVNELKDLREKYYYVVNILSKMSGNFENLQSGHDIQKISLSELRNTYSLSRSEAKVQIESMSLNIIHLTKQSESLQKAVDEAKTLGDQLQTQLDNTITEKDQQNSEILRMKTELELKNNQLQIVNDEKSSIDAYRLYWENESNNLKLQLERVSEENGVLKIQLRHNIEASEIIISKSDDLQSEVDSMLKERQELNRELEDLKSQIFVLNDRYSSDQARWFSEKEAVMVENSKFEQHQKEIEETSEFLQKRLEEVNTQLNQTIASKSEKIQALQSEIQITNEKVAKSTFAIAKLETDLEISKARLQEEQNENENHKVKIEVIETEIQNFKFNLEKMQSRNSELEFEIFVNNESKTKLDSNYERLHSELSEKIVFLQLENDDLKKNFETENELLKQSYQKLSHYSAEIEELGNSIKDAEYRIDILNANNNELHHENIEEIRLQRQKYTYEKNALKTQMKEIKMHLEKKTFESDEMAARIQELERNFDFATSEFESNMESERDTAIRKIQELKKLLESTQHEVTQIISEMKTTINDLRSSLVANTAEMDNLRSLVFEKDREIVEIKLEAENKIELLNEIKTKYDSVKLDFELSEKQTKKMESKVQDLENEITELNVKILQITKNSESFSSKSLIKIERLEATLKKLKEERTQIIENGKISEEELKREALAYHNTLQNVLNGKTEQLNNTLSKLSDLESKHQILCDNFKVVKAQRNSAREKLSEKVDRSGHEITSLTLQESGKKTHEIFEKRNNRVPNEVSSDLQSKFNFLRLFILIIFLFFTSKKPPEIRTVEKDKFESLVNPITVIPSNDRNSRILQTKEKLMSKQEQIVVTSSNGKRKKPDTPDELITPPEKKSRQPLADLTGKFKQ
ncbi:hypothetical protein HK096_009259 [Nowakowskiella sp. JEL0078]|nr:hypothetical protein HK096_009259 [Nowakowskiella sp. JEL0078]